MKGNTIRLLPFLAVSITLILQSHSHKSATQKELKPAGCEEFYKKTGFDAQAVSLKPILNVVNIDEQSFKIIYQDAPRQQKSIAIYKTKQGENLRVYAKPGDMLKKKTDEFSVLIVRPINGALDVQKFDLSCDQ